MLLVSIEKQSSRRRQKKQKANWKKSIHFDILIYRTGFRADDEVGSQRKKEETIMESKKKTKVWSILYPKDSGDIARDEAVKQVSEQLGVSELCAKLLYNRGYKTPQEAKQFLDNETSSLYDPFLMTDIDKAIDRIRQAIEQHEKIVIYGDYDVDGVTAVSTLYLFLSEKGADIEYYIPRRNGEGYGVSCAAIDRLKAQGAELIVTVLSLIHI